MRTNLNPGVFAPNFDAKTASGRLFRLHSWIGESWSIVFSHPGAGFVTELTEVARKLSEIEQRDIKVVGISRNWNNEAAQWNRLLQHYSHQPGAGQDVQIIADSQSRISSMYGLVTERGKAIIPNTAFLVDHRKIIRLVLTYPTSLSSGLGQFLRYVDNNTVTSTPTESSAPDSASRDDTHNNGDVGEDNGGGTPVIHAALDVMHTTKDGSCGDNAVGGDGEASTTNYIQHALNVMDNLADLGKVIPFVAPAFLIIKAIISIEKHAREADTKCTDLVQRITFMLSQLPALKKIQITDSTRQVIDRMNDILKSSAALIQTYRKQSTIARRLSLHNRDRFAACAASLRDCTNDLMVTLQIQQSSQLNLLARPLPSDPEDEAAETFVAAHGGLVAVKENEDLVKQFASERKLSVDDTVMEQLNTNMTEVLQQNQDRLEQSLNESVSTSVVEGIKGLAAQMNELAKEQTFVCLQCDKEYRDSVNGEKSCSFHRAEYDSWNKSYACCSTNNPCQAGRHRSKHHCDYVYGNFFTFARNITGYVDTTDPWIEVEDFNFDTSEKITASVSRLLRWKSRGAAPELPTILVTVGGLSISTPYFFKTLNTKELELASKVVDITHQLVIFRTSHSKEQYAMAQWMLSAKGGIIGITVTVKAATSSKPFIRFCPIDITTASLSGEVKAISEGGLRSYRPSTLYTLPDIERVSAALHEGAPREVRKDFKTRTSPKLPVVLKTVSDPPLVANDQFASLQADNFTGAVSVFNKHPVNSQEPISISSVAAFYRFIGDETYQPVKSMEIVDGPTLPVSVDPRQTWTLKFVLNIPRSEEDAKTETKWWGRSFIARQRPLRIKLVLTDIEEEECSLVLDYVSPVYEQSKPGSDDLAFFYVDDPLTWNRYGVHVTNASHGDRAAIQLGNWTLDGDWMKKLVYNALKNGESEIELEMGENKDEGESTAWSWKSWALVDLSCQRLYAFKILITKNLVGTKGFACLGYVACPEYGDFYDDARPIQYASETTSFPKLDPYISESVLLDDDFDDIVPEVQKASSPAAIGPTTPSVAIPDELTRRLASIDLSLSRLASIDKSLSSMNENIARLGTSIEQLVEILRSKK
ncbi:hypothetical protein D9757_001552 [Collybiopsis confluens]|uniref:Alkyl hydroperoxide reductase subunit C/ Thiol specific antioxidant domain-containing protein n=1 Tax=Collybiopsis confluens TaxID=2823264 RepID=A0A8H5HZ89_9AGAR|nr:hypothetical protein D9757_001552 [Collybiopsis confluens]